jgi:hypothetical protein
MKTSDLLKKIEQTNEITESEILLLKTRLNNGEKIDMDYIWNNEISVTPDQNKKGIEFLLNLYQTPSGKERKNHPFGYREIEILKNFTHFEFKGFYDAGNYLHSYYIPLYVCCGDNNGFEYYYNGKVNIIG